MTKPILMGCIKEQPAPSWLKFNLHHKAVYLDKEIRHLFVADFEFDEKRATEQEYMYNEILTSIIGKKILVANERSLYQLLKFFDKTDDDKPKSYRCFRKNSFGSVWKI